MLDLIHQFDLARWLTTMGYTGILIIIFAETALFFGFFLPGDSLVFTAGVLAAKQVFNIWLLMPMITITAILGYGFAYYFGYKLEHWLLSRRESIFFKKRYVTTAREFYDRHGGKALLFGRMVPIVRTFVGIVAGMAEMPRKRFWIFNIAGGLLWGCGISMLGYVIGGVLPDAIHYLLPAILLVILLSLLPGLIHYWYERRK